MCIKTFIFDLDGTLIFDNKPLHSALESALWNIRQAQHNLIFATSRSVRGVRHVLPAWCLSMPIVYCNGAFATKDSVTVYSHHLSEKCVQRTVLHLEKTTAPFCLELGDAYYHPAVDHPHFTQLALEAPGERVSLETVQKGRSVYKISILRTFPEMNSLINDIVHTFAATAYHHHHGAVDIVSAGCSKWSTMLHIAPWLKESETIAFGDDDNDVCLFEAATHCIAVGGKSAVLQQHADQVIAEQRTDLLCKIIHQHT